ARLATEGGGDVQIGRTQAAGKTIHHVTMRMFPLPFAPAWCVSDKHLIVGLYPQAVKAVLLRDPKAGSLADVPQVAALLTGDKPPLAVGYYDSKSLFESLYANVQMLAPMMLGEMNLGRPNRPGRGRPPLFDVGALPTSRTISKHLQPSTTVVRRTPAGLEVETRQTLPAANIGATAPLAVALALPAMHAATDAARSSEASNNVKQQMLAIHNFHDTYGKLPAAYRVDADGKPLLSWRVAILPFIEQQALYEQFHLDEPWDSEHNKTLIAKMPKTFRAPGSKAAPGQTTYLGVGGKNGVIVKPRDGDWRNSHAAGASFHDIVDGTSNTAAIVEASDALAVVWTKPEEWTPNDKEPIKGLVGLRGARFLVGMADGSVRMISKEIDVETLKNLFNRNDGKVLQLPD
ncbi:MAG: DUF1559 domain-containing protein, partial [Pirellulaceae bacterium]